MLLSGILFQPVYVISHQAHCGREVSGWWYHAGTRHMHGNRILIQKNMAFWFSRMDNPLWRKIFLGRTPWSKVAAWCQPCTRTKSLVCDPWLCHSLDLPSPAYLSWGFPSGKLLPLCTQLMECHSSVHTSLDRHVSQLLLPLNLVSGLLNLLHLQALIHASIEYSTKKVASSDLNVATSNLQPPKRKCLFDVSSP